MERWWCWLSVCLALACSVEERATSLAGDVPFACRSSADCPAGSCLTQFGICTRGGGRLENLLFEVTPQPADPIYGGARYLTVLDVSDAPSDGQRLQLNVRPRVSVTGQVVAAPEQQACLSSGQSTLPVALTFTPRQQLLGLSVPSYEFETPFENVRDYVFRGALPPGHYDVYMRPLTALLGPDCPAIPQMFRDRTVGLMEGAAARLELVQPPPATLRLKVPWKDELEGWRLDIVHSVSGQLLSNQAVLHASEVDPDTDMLEATLNYSRPDAMSTRQDAMSTGQFDELVRLRPPLGVTAGTVLFVRGFLDIITPGEATLGDVSSFSAATTHVQAWVWKRGGDDTPVPGHVIFSAVELDEVEAGVSATFEAEADVDATGQVNVDLLPGRYRVRVTPPALEVPDLGLMAAYEKVVTVWPSAAADMQGGHVIDVPEAASLEGSVVADANDIPLRRVDIRATATHPDRNLCPTGAADASAPTCEPGSPVLRLARAEDPFSPRTRNALSDNSGDFVLEGLDCGRCDGEAPTFFDLTARPDPSTGLPWLVRLSVNPSDAPDLKRNPLRIPMPVAIPMQITYGDPATEPPGAGGTAPEEPRNIGGPSGALVRVFAILDNQGHLVTHPEGLPECWSTGEYDRSRCLQSLIQVAEGRTGSDGDFLLLLPPDVE